MTDPEGKSTNPLSSKPAFRRGVIIVALLILLGAGFVVFQRVVPALIDKEFRSVVQNLDSKANDSALKFGEEYADSPTERLRRQVN